MMVMLDTDIIASSVLRPSGLAYKAFVKSLYKPFEPVVSNYILDELHRRFGEKFPNRITELEAFLYHMLRAVLILPTPEATIYDDNRLSGNDRPIFRAAINAAADYIITGHKGFLESGVGFPYIVSAQEFLKL